MPPKQRSVKSTTTNVPFWTWADGSPFEQPIDEWEPEPEQLGWGSDDDNHDAQRNVEFDEPSRKARLSIPAEEQREISGRITEFESRDSYVPRSDRPHEESVTLTQLNDNNELVVNRFAEALEHGRADLNFKKPMNKKLENLGQYRLTTDDIAAAEDLATTGLNETLSSKTLLTSRRTSSRRSVRGIIRPPQPPQPSAEALEALLSQPEAPCIPLTTKGFQLGLRSLEISPGKEATTFALYAADKLSGLNPGNCDADLLAKCYAAMLHKEEELHEAGRIDQNGRPLTNAGKDFGSHTARSQALQAWFHDAMLSVDRVVGRHLPARTDCAGETFVEAPPRLVKKSNKPPIKPPIALKTFRLCMYQVMERKPDCED